MLFVSLGVSFALRMTFPLILTQMVYVPNVNNEKNDTTSSNGELICPIEQAEPQDETGNQVCARIKMIIILMYPLFIGQISFRF